MPRTLSAEKQARKALVKRERLLPYKTHMKTMIRKISDAVKGKKKDEVTTLLPLVYKAIDTAAKKQIIHVNTASRKKSFVARLAASVSK